MHLRSAVLGDDHFEIFAGYDQRAVLGNIEFVEQSMEISLERRAGLRIDRRKRLHDRAVVSAENPGPVAGRLVAEDKVPALRRDGRLRTKQAVEMRLGAP